MSGPVIVSGVRPALTVEQELLAAAKQAEALIPHLCDLDSSAAAASVVEQLRSAIARATGGAS